METKILHKIKGEEGIEAHVAQIDRGFSVAIYDTDSEQYFPSVKIWPTEVEALTDAKKIEPKF